MCVRNSEQILSKKYNTRRNKNQWVSFLDLCHSATGRKKEQMTKEKVGVKQMVIESMCYVRFYASV